MRGGGKSTWATSAFPDAPRFDLLVFQGGQRLGYEVKYTDRPRLSKSQHLALEHLRLDRLTIVTPGAADYPLADRIHVRGLHTLIGDPLPSSTPDL